MSETKDRRHRSDPDPKAAAIVSPRAAKPVGPYPHARRAGDFLFLSGIGPRRPGTDEIHGVTRDGDGNVIGHDIVVQTRAVMDNLRAVLAEADSSIDDVVDVMVFLTHMKRDFQRFNEAYAEAFASVRPARTTVEVTALPTPIAIELKVIAYVG